MPAALPLPRFSLILGTRNGSFMRLLLVENHRPLVRAFRQQLEEEGASVDVAFDGVEADRHVANADYDVIVLDLMLPQNDGLTLIKKWRERGVRAHIVILTAKEASGDELVGLQLGANDSLIKPFEIEQLLALVRPLIGGRNQLKSRTFFNAPAPRQAENGRVLHVHDLTIDTSSHSVRRAGKTVRLTPREYALLEFLAVHRGKTVTRTMIWGHLYRQQDEKMSNVIDVYIRYLRNKIDKGFDLPLIRTRWGAGYVLGDNEIEVPSKSRPLT